MEAAGQKYFENLGHHLCILLNCPSLEVHILVKNNNDGDHSAFCLRPSKPDFIYIFYISQ